MMAKIVKDGRPLQRSQQQQTDKDLWKFSAVSAVAATADLVENEPDRSSRKTRNARGRGSGQGSNAIQKPQRHAKSGSKSMVGRLQIWTRVGEIWNESAIRRFGAGRYIVEQKATMSVFDDARL